MEVKTNLRMPAEWEEHAATWIAWPHEPTDWPGKLPAIDWVYCEIARVLTGSEQVQILCANDEVLSRAAECLELARVPRDRYQLHSVNNDRSWLRDSMPTAVIRDDGSAAWVGWSFRAWAKYDNFLRDKEVPAAAAKISGLKLISAKRPDNGEAPTLEGGALEVDGLGTMLTTEECLLSEVQQRNPGLDRGGYEKLFAEFLGIKKTIWLGRGCVGDDTHGHIDDIARFVAPGKVVLAYESNPQDENHESSEENFQTLSKATDARGEKLEVIKLPMPRAIWHGEERLPASYANFYIANKVVIVPTFNDENDRVALGVLERLFPTRKVIGIHAVDLVLGQGTLHCLTQQEPAGRGK